jgi:hypothetical protein
VSGTGQGAFKFEGAWIATVTSLRGVPGPFPFQWSYVFEPDASGRTATIHGTVDVAFPPNSPLLHDFMSPLIGEAIQTDPDTAAFNVYWAAIKKASSPPYIDRIVFIGRAWGEGRSVAEGKAEMTHHFEFYLPSIDADGDGIPDEGSSPIASFLVTTQDTRISPPVR